MASLQIQDLRKCIAMARSRFLYGLDRTRDDRLEWSPGGSALTPLQLAGKAAATVSVMTRVLQERTMPERPATPPPPPGNREEAKAAVDAAFARLQSMLRNLTEEDLKQTVPTPWGQPILVTEMLWWLPTAIGYLQGQLNYLQSAYGDTDPNIPPNWGREEG